ncbi:MAG: U32 family peptidase [Clostridia bacterium]|nr:U32 family peptidase [Clostridia bacterium]
MENLAPAGNRAALERANAAGADAVYLGYTAFSARAGAGNFSREELAEAIRFAHLRHMRVHVTVNILMKDAELPELLEVLKLLRDLHADALLIQDLGALRLIRKRFPELPVHISTQMAIHNRTGVRWCRSMGAGRVVLARECSLDEIRLCCREPVEIEVFGHGAQCVAASGLCLFSSMVGERSGNRGRCAQPCRMTYTLDGRTGAWLSPRDVCLRDDLPALAEAGVASVKLEGRLKRPEYVGVVASSYRRGLDGIRQGNFRPADEREKEGLLQIFNRGGLMRGYAFGCEDAGVIDPERVNHQGLPLGSVEKVSGNLAQVRVTRTLHDGDGLVLSRDREIGEMIYAGPEVPAGRTAMLRLRPDLRVRTGDTVRRLTDARQLAEVQGMPLRQVPADLYIRAVPGEALELTATDGESTVTVRGETVQEARTRAAEPEELIRSLRKTGDTAFVPRTAEAETRNAFVPVSAVNSPRREALERLAEARIRAFENRDDITAAAEEAADAPTEISLPAGEVPPTAVVRTREQAEAARAGGFRVVWYPEDFREEALEGLMADMPAGDWLRLPDVCEEAALDMLQGLTERWREKLGGLMLGNVGQLGRQWPVPFGAGSGIPVMNRQAAALLLEQGCAFVTASPELTGKEWAALTAGKPPVLAPVYGRTQLMILHHCPARTALGLSQGHRDCRMCDEKRAEALEGKELTDRRGYSFPLLRQRLPEGCLVRLMNTLPTDLLDKQENYQLVELTTETGRDAEEIIRSARSRRRTGLEATSGHWNRPVL